MVILGLGIVDQNTVVLAFVLAATGLLLLAAGWFGLIPKSTVSVGTSITVNETVLRFGCAIGASTILYLLTGWPVVAAFGALGGWFAITLKNAKRERHAAIDRVDAIATWVENLRDNISGSAGLQQALRMSGDYAPESIRPEIRDLVLRLQHEPVVQALRRFAADVAHPTSDMAVACLILATSRSAGSLASVLAKTAQAARDSASMLRQVEAGRSATQSQAKLVSFITGLVALAITVARPEFVAPYDTFGGQIALFVICSVVAASAAVLYRVSKPAKQERVFRGVEAQIDDLATEAIPAGASA